MNNHFGDNDYVNIDETGEPKPKKAPKRGGELKAIIITLLVALGLFYIQLPAINLKSQGFYSYICIVLIVYTVARLPAVLRKTDFDFRNVGRRNLKPLVTVFYPAVVMLGLVGLCMIGALVSSPIIRAGAYRELITVEPGSFTEDVAAVTFDQVPMLDKASAQVLGNRKLGELSDLVSQFEVAGNYNQINYKARPVRVTPLEYGDFYKWIGNRKEGLPAYIIVDMLSQEVTVQRMQSGMKYSMSEPFFRNTYRTLRFRYPTYMFSTPVFEIDDAGIPYWVCPRVTNTIGLFGGRDVIGTVLMNAQTGEMQYIAIEDVPQWVDAVYNADLIIEQYDYYGRYRNGFWNSIFGQKGMTMTTAGYNYLALNDDVYVYTGITSVGGDESNIGFILTNQRTKATHFYAIPGAEEYSAMSSAEGVVQHLAYQATFPLLLNVYNQPTYFMALKDNAELVKMYAMVNVSSYQIVATGTSIAECQRAYIQLIQNNGIVDPGDSEGTIQGIIEEIRTAVIDGNSIYYIKLQGEAGYFSMSAITDSTVVVLSVGDEVEIGYTFKQEGITPAVSIKLK